MKRKKVILITGANGEVGHGLIEELHNAPDGLPVVAIDVHHMDDKIMKMVDNGIVGDILDLDLMNKLDEDYEIEGIYHLAALLSTSAEHKPELAHRVNSQGTINLLELCTKQAQERNEFIKFIFPSSIGVFGVPDLETKTRDGAVSEEQHLTPITMYGCSKLYGEHLGRYYSFHHRQLTEDRSEYGVDFRSVRFPGLISAFTVPTGGTSDYGPEMLHAAAKGEAYASFVRPDTTMPFMVMPDAIKSLLTLAAAPRDALSTVIYNLTSFSLSAEEIAEQVKKYFPEAQISYDPSPGRQKIVDSWPADMDDTVARKDWGWSPDYDVEWAFADYLVPNIKKRYQ